MSANPRERFLVLWWLLGLNPREREAVVAGVLERERRMGGEGICRSSFCIFSEHCQYSQEKVR